LDINNLPTTGNPLTQFVINIPRATQGLISYNQAIFYLDIPPRSNYPEVNLNFAVAAGESGMLLTRFNAFPELSTVYGHELSGEQKNVPASWLLTVFDYYLGGRFYFAFACGGSGTANCTVSVSATQSGGITTGGVTTGITTGITTGVTTGITTGPTTTTSTSSSTTSIIATTRGATTQGNGMTTGVNGVTTQGNGMTTGITTANQASTTRSVTTNAPGGATTHTPGVTTHAPAGATTHSVVASTTAAGPVAGTTHESANSFGIQIAPSLLLVAVVFAIMLVY